MDTDFEQSSTNKLKKSPCKSVEQAENHEKSPNRVHAGRGPEAKREIPG
jgi:hypothetical protein